MKSLDDVIGALNACRSTTYNCTKCPYYVKDVRTSRKPYRSGCANREKNEMLTDAYYYLLELYKIHGESK